MKNLVKIQEAKVVTSSLQVAQTFCKEHKNVLRCIENLGCSDEFRRLNFELSFYIRQLPTGGQKKEPMYVITKDGFTFLAMGFTGKKADQFKEDYINAFNKMEEHIKNQQKPQLPSQPALPSPHGKYRRKRVETYMPADDVLRLQITAYNEGYNSIYHLLQTLIYEFLESPYSSVKEKIKHIEQERNTWRQLCEERNQFLGDIYPFIKDMNQTIAEKNTLIEKYQKQIRLLKEAI